MSSDYSYYHYLLSKALRKFDDQVFMFNLCLSRATGSVSGGNVPVFDVIGSKEREIASDDIVTTENEESCPWQHRNFKPVAPYSTNTCSKYLLLN